MSEELRVQKKTLDTQMFENTCVLIKKKLNLTLSMKNFVKLKNICPNCCLRLANN